MNLKTADIVDKNDADTLLLSSALLDWYDEFGRDLPWRVRGAHPNPYVVWVSEIMLQQTTVKSVIPYFHRFLKRFSDLESLANADIEEVLLLWQGLGYYTRARKLHECALLLVKKYGGQFPQTYGELLKLPGIGPYTAASISSLAFNQREAVVDGNVIRVISRLYGISESTATSLPDIKNKAQNLMSENRCADYTSAIMDLGATVCTPKNPQCPVCPFQKKCVALEFDLISEIPKIEKLQKINKFGQLFWIENEFGEVFIQKRTEKGLLHGLTEFPWNAQEAAEEADAIKGSSKTPKEIPFPVNAEWIDTGKNVRHVFTHINLTLEIYQTKIDSAANETALETLKKSGGWFVSKSDFKEYPFSTLMKKVIQKMDVKKTLSPEKDAKKADTKKTNTRKTNTRKTDTGKEDVGKSDSDSDSNIENKNKNKSAKRNTNKNANKKEDKNRNKKISDF